MYTSNLPRRGTCLALLTTVFAASRLLCLARGVRFDAYPLQIYWQYIDPALLQHDFWRSIWYLEQQPPLFNFFLGAILHLFPAHPAIGFQAVYLLLGLILSLSLFELMDRLRVDRRIALAIALLFAIGPSTILYENLLFYEYPLTVLFTVAALFLHRYANSGKLSDAVVFFSATVVIAGIRSIYNLVWYALLIAMVLVALRAWRRRTLLAAAIPALLLTAFYLKHFILFHEFAPGGRAFMALNLSSVLVDPVPEESLDQLIAAHKITPILQNDMFELGDDFDVDPRESDIAKIVPVPPKTGIPVLDNCVKSTLAFNWNCVWAADVADVYTRDSWVVFRNYPRAYLESLSNNFARYFWPDTERWPFDGRKVDANEKILHRPLAIYNLLTSGEWPPRIEHPWLAYVVVPALLGYGIFLAFKKPQPLVLIFMVGSIVYISTIVILLAEADQNRYRSEMSPFYAVLLALAAQQIHERRTAPKNPA